MDNVFLDTNILIDYLAARTPFDEHAKTIIQRAEKGDIIILISVLSICNIAYILRKLSPEKDVKLSLADLSSIATLTSVTEDVISDALSSSFTDFEDAVQHFSAFRHGGVTHFLTRNVTDFKNSLLKVATPADYLSVKP